MVNNYDLKVDYASLREHDFLEGFPKEIPVWICSPEDEKLFLTRLITLFLIKHDLIKKTYIEAAAKIELVFGQACLAIYNMNLRLHNILNSILLDVFKVLKQTNRSIEGLENLILINQIGAK